MQDGTAIVVALEGSGSRLRELDPRLFKASAGSVRCLKTKRNRETMRPDGLSDSDGIRTSRAITRKRVPFLRSRNP